MRVCVCGIGHSKRAKDGERRRDINKNTGKAAVTVVGSAAKTSWSVTKFAVKTTAKPIAKTLFTRAAPSAGKFALKMSAKPVAHRG